MNAYPHFPKDKFRVRVQHYPHGVDHFHRQYTTEISVYHVNSKSIPYFTVYSKCNPIDQPRRSIGFQIAYSKAIACGLALGLISAWPTSPMDKKE
jgi:hypothetical protein